MLAVPSNFPSPAETSTDSHTDDCVLLSDEDSSDCSQSDVHAHTDNDSPPEVDVHTYISDTIARLESFSTLPSPTYTTYNTAPYEKIPKGHTEVPQQGCHFSCR